ncbi:Delta-latroinsectotoxin-Lt1a [Diplonema papillatum]|nr:Delta-latroinsectotoxin-Lt1a [Diplonema papillatum]
MGRGDYLTPSPTPWSRVATPDDGIDRGYPEQALAGVYGEEVHVPTAPGSGRSRPARRSTAHVVDLIEKERVTAGQRRQIDDTMSRFWNNPPGWDDLYGAKADAVASGGSIVELRLFLKQQGPATLEALRRRTKSLLHLACEKRPVGNLAMLVMLIAEFGLPIDATCQHKGRPLHTAARHGCLLIVQYLLTYDDALAGLNCAIPATGNTPLHEAVVNGKVEVVRTLAEYGALINKPNLRKQTPFLLSCKHGSRAVVEYLLDAHAPLFDINAIDKDNMPAVYYAVAAGSACLLQLLLDRGASLRYPSLYWTPLQLACRQKDHDAALALVQFLLPLCDDPNVHTHHNSLVSLAVKQGNSKLAAFLRERGLNEEELSLLQR